MPRPPSPLLDRPTIARAALAELDARETFTMPGLAKSLGVAVSSLYHHVKGREEVIELVRGSIAESMNSDVDWSGEWRECVAEWVRAYRNAFGAHPALVRVLTRQTVAAPGILASYDNLASALRDAGFVDSDLLHIITVLDTLALGSALDVAAPDDVWSTEGLAADSPLAVAVAAAPRGSERADAAFELGLGLILDGLERRRRPNHEGPSPRAS
ncbi:TetR/AcrR family transcriptional regulator C-terminal domain-containing protein [Gordonia sp. CPCC 205515]|uniref:TetR/AcrR family transcriptional regulator n=1 Tax=Gordonia sp. CPCC 205515 TaxID=3140791 RepID=UPI003AF3CBCB